ncbi:MULTISPECIES: glycosyltransferase family 1 protein [Thermocrispum]|jgi:glycosyltransferase involved in cell wall biosynthesis|uniref:Glycosyltransferase family 1 protein n=1 Tax=Thermocrispum agreste TaxID=37925 RepID=A0A2W4ITR9_9PSEU|nr:MULTISPECIES: glycosyltransferase family 1 protein [Thermocrispum]PZM89598.1 MAG: glycosyltransferase family 1 protein [Thermocrispum agreste]
MRVAINLLTDDPAHPSGAHWFWTRIIPEMAKRMTGDEELHLLVSPKMRPLHTGYGPNVHYIMFPWSNERRWPRTLSEHLYAPVRLPRAGIDVFNTLLAPVVKPAPGLVAHIKTLHAYTTPGAIGLPTRVYRRLSYPHTARAADAIVINSQSLKAEVQQYLDVDESKLRLITEGVDHDRFRPGDPDQAWHHLMTRYQVRKPFVLFVSSLWRYKNCHGLIEAFARAKPQLGDDMQLVVVGAGRDAGYVRELHDLAGRLGVAGDVVWIGAIPQAETVWFYRCAEVFAYPSFNETFGLPILEAMATGCPVVTSDVTAMPETAGDAALLADPGSPESIAEALIQATKDSNALRERGFAHAAKFTWEATAEQTLQVYREVHANRRSR